ncbi:MAG TPA: ABC transporter ATP-binding protein [Clostridiaceae bacterium]
MPAAVTIRKLTKTYEIKRKKFEALKGIDLDIEEGSFVTVVGKSGCGKTTLLRILCGLEDKTSGDLGLDPSKVSIVFQEPRLMPWLTVRQNMGFPLISASDRLEAEMTVDKCLDMLGLQGFRDAYPSQISGGMAQRVALGRTLCYDPKLILMDEPLGALDAFNRRKLQNDLVDIFLRYRKTIVFVTHDVEEAIYLGQKIVVMDEGKVLKELPVEMPYPRDAKSREFIGLREDILSLILDKKGES